MSSGIELQPNEMCRLRDYIRSTVTKSLKAIRQHNPNIKFDKNNEYREYFIGETIKSVELTFDRYLENPILNQASFGEIIYDKDSSGLIFAHLDEIEMKTFDFLQNITSVKNDGFKTAFLHECKVCIEETYDIFGNEVQWSNESKYAPTNSNDKSADTDISTNSSFDLNASWMTVGTKNSRKKAACSPFHDLNDTDQIPKKPLLMTTNHNQQSQQARKIRIIQFHNQYYTVQEHHTIHSNTDASQSISLINASNGDTTHLTDQNSVAKQPTVTEEALESVNQKDVSKNTVIVTKSPETQNDTTQKVYTIIDRAGDLLYRCYYCKGANKSNPTFDDEKSVFNHWQMHHEKEQSKPFQFYAEETARCYHCDFCGLWPELVKHHIHTHPNMPFAITNGNDRTNCAFCEYTGKNMPKHIQTKHMETLQNPNTESLTLRNGFIKISAKNVEKLFSNGEHERTEMMRFICDNNHLPTLLAREDLLEHLQEHGIECSCQFKTKSLFDLLLHKRDVHGHDDMEQYQDLFEIWLKNEFHKMMALFENGLVLPNGNLDATRFKHFQDFHYDSNDFMATMKSEFQEETANKYCLKIVVCHIPSEDVKMIFRNLCQKLAIQINWNDIVRIGRSESKRVIVVECRHEKLKRQIVRSAAAKIIWSSDLVSTSSVPVIPPDMNRRVQFEF